MATIKTLADYYKDTKYFCQYNINPSYEDGQRYDKGEIEIAPEADNDEITRFLVDEAVRQEFWYPDWPRGTKVVVFARKEDREKVLMKVSQIGYAVSKFVEMDGLQAEIMGEGRFFAIKADTLRQLTPSLEAPLPTAGLTWEDSMRNGKLIIKEGEA